MSEKKRVRQTKEAAQNTILEKCLELMATEGWRGVTFQAIGKRCGMSPSNLVYHFQNRESLLMGLLGHISENNWKIVNEAMRPEFDSYERLLTHFQQNLEWARRFPDQAQVLIEIYALAQYSPEFSEVFRLMIERATGRIREHLLAGKRERRFKYVLKDLDMAKYLHNLLLGAFMYVASGRMVRQDLYSRDEWDQILKPILGYSERPAKSSG